jgi:Domain of unknown function (DUF4145)
VSMTVAEIEAKMPLVGKWDSAQAVAARRYTCGYCGSLVAPERGWNAYRVVNQTTFASGHILICSLCNQPTFFKLITNSSVQVPNYMPGASVKNLPQDIAALYDEARQSHAARAFTAAVLALRKLLMHVAVEKGAEKGQSFIAYVEYLDENHYLGRGGKAWVDKIRTRSNEANHEIILMSEEDSDHLMKLSEMLLRLVYEFPGSLEPEK